MDLTCFNYSQDPAEGSNRIFKKRPRPTHVTQMHGAGDVADWMHKPESTEEMPEWAKESQSGVETTGTLRAKVETERRLAEMPRPVDRGSKERLDERFIREIFGSKECMDWYVDRVRKALTTGNGDKLYDFIRAHPEYSKDNHIKWNRDFVVQMGLDNPNEIPAAYRGANTTIRDRRFVAAAQRVLVDECKSDVFKITFREENPNPWPYVDGEGGPFTVSVMNDYWMAKFSKRSKKRPIPPGRSAPSEKSYSRKSESYALWLAAIRYLNDQRIDVSSQEESPEDTPPHVSYAEQIRREYEGLDQAGDSIKMSELVVEDNGPFDLPMSLMDALGNLYGETPQLKKAPKTYRVMHLLAEKLGAQVKQIGIRAGDRLEITPQGVFKLTSKNKSKAYEVNLNA